MAAGWVAFVPAGEAAFAAQPVRPGLRQGDHIEIKGDFVRGVPKQVVAEGSHLLKSKIMLDKIESGEHVTRPGPHRRTMLEKIIAWSLSHRIAVLAGAAPVCLAGYASVNGLVIDAFPDTTPVQVQINTVAPGMVAEEIERQITFPVELAMGGMPGLEELRSASMFGLSVVIVTFRDGTDIYFARAADQRAARHGARAGGRGAAGDGACLHRPG